MVLLVWVYYKGQFLCFFRGQFFVVIKKAAVLATFFGIVYSKLHTCLLMVNLFESSFTCVPICLFFTGSQLKLHRLFSRLLQRGSSHDSVVRCHLLRKCPGIIRNASPQASLFRFIPAVSCPLPRLVGQALTRLVTVSSMCYHTSTSALSTSSSSRGFTS